MKINTLKLLMLVGLIAVSNATVHAVEPDTSETIKKKRHHKHRHKHDQDPNKDTQITYKYESRAARISAERTRRIEKWTKRQTTIVANYLYNKFEDLDENYKELLQEYLETIKDPEQWEALKEKRNTLKAQLAEQRKQLKKDLYEKIISTIKALTPDDIKKVYQEKPFYGESLLSFTEKINLATEVLSYSDFSVIDLIRKRNNGINDDPDEWEIN